MQFLLIVWKFILFILLMKHFRSSVPRDVTLSKNQKYSFTEAIRIS